MRLRDYLHNLLADKSNIDIKREEGAMKYIQSCQLYYRYEHGTSLFTPNSRVLRVSRRTNFERSGTDW